MHFAKEKIESVLSKFLNTLIQIAKFNNFALRSSEQEHSIHSSFVPLLLLAKVELCIDF